MDVKNNLKIWRISAGYTQGDMAKALGVHINTYRSWEENPNKVSIEYADKISKLVGATRNEVFPEPSI